MSKFSAINLSDDEVDLEEHTRELQIEESLKLFKKLLHLQKDKNYVNAFEVYEKLFKIDVISDFSPSTTAVSNLRYLSYRNRGFLKFDKLLDDHEVKPDSSLSEDDESLDNLYDDLMSCIEDLITALIFGEGDTNLVELIYQIFDFFGNERLTRFILEYEIMKNDISMGNESNLLVMRRNKVSSTFNKFLCRYKLLLVKLGDYESTLSSDSTFINRNKISIHELAPNSSKPVDLSFLGPLKKEISVNQFKNMWIPKNVEIDLSKYQKSEIRFSIILKEIQQVLPKLKTRSKKFFDNYYITDDPIEVVIFKLLEEKDEVVEITDSDDAEMIEVDAEQMQHDIEDLDDVQLSDDTQLDRKDSESGETKEHDSGKQEEKERERTRSSRRLNLNQLVEEPPKITELDFSYQEKFLTSLKAYLDLLNEQKGTDYAINDIINPLKDNGFSFKDMHLNDFLNILDGWNRQRSDLLLVNIENNRKNISVMEILNADGLSNFVPIESKSIENYDLSELISSINSNVHHYHQLRIEVLEFVSKVQRNKETLIIDYKIDTASYLQLKQFLDCSDILLYTKTKDNLNLTHNIDIAVFVFEMLVDAYIDIYQELEANKNLEKHRTASAELSNQKKILSMRIERWKTLLQDLMFIHKDTSSVLYMRFEWCDLTYLQHQDILSVNNEEILKKRLSLLFSHKTLLKTDINYLNYRHIQRLNNDTVKIQLSKLSILTTFSNIFKEDSGLNNPDKIILLEKILFPDPSAEKTKEQENMEEFVESSTLELKLKLFQVLLDYYRKIADIPKYQYCVEHIISLLYSNFTSKNYRKQTSFMRQQELLRLYAFFGEFIQHYVMTLSENNWSLTNTQPAVFQKILEFFRLAYLFCLHEDIAVQCSLKTSLKTKSPKSFAKLKDIVTSLFTITFVYYESMVRNQPGQINDLIDLLHDQLGSRKYCEAANGMFLKLLEDTLVKLGWAESEKDILQIISCRYKLHISVDGFVPANHETNGIPFDKLNALEIAKYVLPLCFKKRNPIVNTIKSDIKVLLDSIYEAVGDPDDKNESVARCSALLDEFLDNTPLNVKVMRHLFYGLGSLDLERSKLDIQQAIDNGLYYLQGVNAFNIFKVRKRSMQSRISELDFVIKMIKQDLFCGSNRIESWMILGQTYGFLVEDDLIWTSDKLTNEDKKESTAILQKKSLLCYLMAINCYTTTVDKTKLGVVSGMMWSSFAKELYNASMEPMDNLCFNVNSVPIYFKRRTKIFEKSFTNPISQKTILKLLLSSFKMAAKLNDKDWLNFYYIAKLEHKVGSDPQTIFHYLLKSCTLAKSNGSHSDPIIEPHYLLCSLAYKLTVKEDISIDDAISYLEKDSVFKISKDDTIIEDKSSFAYFLIECLKQICALDKKNWHHKPHYRIAKIQMSMFQDTDSAKQEMLTLINLKPTVKNLVTIWKPEYERPGKHFVYNLQYVLFTIEIFYEEADLASLLALGRKLRRFGASIVHLLKAWGEATKKICDLSRRYADIDSNYSEKCISSIVYGEFMVKAMEFNNYLNERHGGFENENHQNLLYLFTELGEIKRMSNGFSQTAYIDDTFYCIYLKLYFIYRKELDTNTQVVNVEDAVKSKVAKRDIAEVIKSLRLPKLPEKLPQYHISKEKTEMEMPNNPENNIADSISESKKVDEEKSETVILDTKDDSEKPNFNISVLSMINQEEENEPIEIIDDDEEAKEFFETPESKKRVFLPDDDASKKKLKLDLETTEAAEVISDDDEVFVTPKKSFEAC